MNAKQSESKAKCTLQMGGWEGRRQKAVLEIPKFIRICRPVGAVSP
jgi:hypothetical protein